VKTRASNSQINYRTRVKIEGELRALGALMDPINSKSIIMFKVRICNSTTLITIKCLVVNISISRYYLKTIMCKSTSPMDLVPL